MEIRDVLFYPVFVVYFYHIALLAQQHAMAKRFMDIKYNCEIKSMT